MNLTYTFDEQGTVSLIDQHQAEIPRIHMVIHIALVAHVAQSDKKLVRGSFQTDPTYGGLFHDFSDYTTSFKGVAHLENEGMVSFEGFSCCMTSRQDDPPFLVAIYPGMRQTVFCYIVQPNDSVLFFQSGEH